MKKQAMEDNSKPKKKGKGNPNPVNKYKPGQCGNPGGRPTKVKTFDELVEYVKKKAVSKVHEYWISGKVWEDIDDMSSMKRYAYMMDFIKSFSTQMNSPQASDNNQPMKIEVVFGKKEETPTIELKPKENQEGSYE